MPSPREGRALPEPHSKIQPQLLILSLLSAPVEQPPKTDTELSWLLEPVAHITSLILPRRGLGEGAEDKGTGGLAVGFGVRH